MKYFLTSNTNYLITVLDSLLLLVILLFISVLVYSNILLIMLVTFLTDLYFLGYAGRCSVTLRIAEFG